MTQFIDDAKQSFFTEMAYRTKTGQNGPLPPANFLAIFGGGDDGAYGAGLLCGWTESGSRSEFKLATGISTGALIASFAFLGPKYDAKLTVPPASRCGQIGRSGFNYTRALISNRYDNQDAPMFFCD